MSLESLKLLLGPGPTPVPLESAVDSRVECGTYERIFLSYWTEEDDRIPAYLLIPRELKQPAPAVFCHHQHAGNYALGKSEVVGLEGDPNQGYAHELVERGYVVLAPDALGFEGRNWSDGTSGTQQFEFVQRLVRGRTLLAKVLHDVSVGIDLLSGRDEVDPNRIGFLGHSYGGRMAIWCAAFDKRIKASVSNCGCARYRDTLSPEAGIQTEFCIPNILSWGDIEDVVRLIEPNSLLIQAATDDKWSRGYQTVYDRAAPAFSTGTLQLSSFKCGHEFSAEMRENAYRFLDAHLRAD